MDRPRPSSIIFIEKGRGSVDRDLIFPLTNRILERERFEGLENSRGISLLPSSATFRTCSIPFERGRRRRKGERGRKSGCIDPDAEIPDLHRAIISGTRNVGGRRDGAVFFRDRTREDRGACETIVIGSLLSRPCV